MPLTSSTSKWRYTLSAELEAARGAEGLEDPAAPLLTRDTALASVPAHGARIELI